MQLTTGVVNLTGMLVYNTTATLGQIGIYYWNGATWVKASLPSTSAADSGKFLMSNGTYASWMMPSAHSIGVLDTLNLKAPIATTMQKILDSTIYPAIPVYTFADISVPGLLITDWCITRQGWVLLETLNNIIRIWPTYSLGTANALRLRCYRLSN